MVSKEELDRRLNMTDEEVQALTFNDVAGDAMTMASQAKSSVPLINLTVDITDAAVRAWEAVRDGGHDLSKLAIAIMVSPEVYFTIAATGAALRQGAKPGDLPSEQTRKELEDAIRDAREAYASKGTGTSHMAWDGIVIYPDARIPYISVGAVKVRQGETHVPQVFDAQKFADLQQTFAGMLDLDEQTATSEKMDKLATVAGVVGSA